MKTTDLSAQVRAILEEELSEFRAFADLPASGIEIIAARLTRALAPVLETPQPEVRSTAA